MKTKEYLCTCNNCDAILIDTNPQTGAKQYFVDANKFKTLIDLNCPNCGVDDYLKDEVNFTAETYYKDQLNLIEVGKTEYAPTFKIFANGNGQDTKNISLNADSAKELIKWLTDNFIDKEPKTNVKFLVDSFGDTIAFFPDMPFNEDKNLKTCYANIGQHSACHVDYAKGCKKATPKKYKELKTELESLGYNLNVLKHSE